MRVIQPGKRSQVELTSRGIAYDARAAHICDINKLNPVGDGGRLVERRGVWGPRWSCPDAGQECSQLAQAVMPANMTRLHMETELVRKVQWIDSDVPFSQVTQRI